MLKTFGGGVARYGVPGVVIGLAIASLLDLRTREAAAQTSPNRPAASRAPAPNRAGDNGKSVSSKNGSSTDSSGTIAMVANPGGPVQWLYLIDTKKQAFAIYKIDPGTPNKVVKLEACRQYQWDLKLEQYNNQTPEPSDIEAQVRTLDQNNP
jgi:hypothetical protein